MIWFVLSLVAWVGFLVAQGFLIELAVALTGEPPPSYSRATGAVIVAGLLSLFVRTALGVAGWFIGGWVASVLSAVAMLTIATVVYYRSFGLRPFQGLVVAALHFGLASALWWVASAITRLAYAA